MKEQNQQLIESKIRLIQSTSAEIERLNTLLNENDNEEEKILIEDTDSKEHDQHKSKVAVLEHISVLMNGFRKHC